MASDDELTALHRAADIPADDTTYTDDLLAGLIDGLGSVEAAAAAIWREKAAAVSGLVNIAEAGSSRSLSDLHKNALDMAKGYDAALATQVEVKSRRSYVSQSERL